MEWIGILQVFFFFLILINCLLSRLSIMNPTGENINQNNKTNRKMGKMKKPGQDRPWQQKQTHDSFPFSAADPPYGCANSGRCVGKRYDWNNDRLLMHRCYAAQIHRGGSGVSGWWRSNKSVRFNRKITIIRQSCD